MIPLPYEDYTFLEAPHAHDPDAIADIVALPKALRQSTPDSLQQLLFSVQESASIVFASMSRLEALHEERLERLCPSASSDDASVNRGYVANLENGKFAAITVDERTFHTFKIQLQAEKRYFREEAAVDFRQKTKVIEGERSYLVTTTGWNSADTGFDTWWNGLQDMVGGWIERADTVSVMGFKDTVEEMQKMFENFAKRNSS